MGSFKDLISSVSASTLSIEKSLGPNGKLELFVTSKDGGYIMLDAGILLCILIGGLLSCDATGKHSPPSPLLFRL